MPLIYAAVTRGAAVLAEYSVFSGNFSAVAKDYLTKAAATGGGGSGGGGSGGGNGGGARSSYTVDGHVFSFLTDDGLTFVVVTDEAAGRTIPNAFLDRARADFLQRHADKARGAKEGALQGPYGRRLKELMEHATQYPEEYSKVAGVQKRVDEVKAVMADNIEKVLSRGEKLDLLVDKTDNLMHEADRFVKSGRALRRKMWWNNCKMKVVMAGVVVLVIFIIVLLVCFGAGGTRCVRKKHVASPSPSPAAGAPAASPAAATAPSGTNATAAQPQAPASGGDGARRLLLEALQAAAASRVLA